MLYTKIHSVTFGNTSQIDQQAFLAKEDCLRLIIQNNVLMINMAKPGLKCLLAWLLALPVVVQVTDRPKADIKSTIAKNSYFFRFLQNLKQAGAYLHWVIRCFTVKAREFGVLPVPAHVPVYLVEHCQNIFRDCISNAFLISPKLKLHRCRHSRICVTEPLCLSHRRHQKYKKKK